MNQSMKGDKVGRLEGRVALITGAARGQGRAHALRMAEEGAHIVAIDIGGGVATARYPVANADDLAETVDLVDRYDCRILARQVDVRDQAALIETVDEAKATLGPVDIVVANAGINQDPGASWSISEQIWQEMIDINLTGVWHTVKAAIPGMVDAGRGGAITLTSSVAGLKAAANISAYVAAKHALVGLMRSLAIELAPHGIRVNTVHPTTVNTDMILNDLTYRLFCPDMENPTLDDALDRFRSFNLMPVPWVESVDIANAVLWLSSDEARYITGATLPIDAGCCLK